MKPWSRPWNAALTLALAATVVVVSCLLPRDDGGAAAFSPDGSLTRDRIPDRYKWDLAPLFADDAAWERTLGEVSAGLERLGAFRGKLSDPAQLARCLTLYLETRLATNRVTLYASLRLDTQHKSAPLQAMKDRSLVVLDRLMAAASFIRQEVLKLDDAAMERAYAAAPGLAEHRPYLRELRRRRSRVLGEEGERLLTLAGDNLWAEIDLNEIPSDHEKTFLALLTDMPLPKVRDEKGKEVQLTLSNYGKYRGSRDRRVRRETVAALFSSLRRYERTFAATFAGQIRYTVFLARARGYDHALDAYLDKDDIDPAVYRNLIRTVRANLEPLHDYVRLRKEVMGLDELHLYDLYEPLVEEVELTFPFEAARELLPKALAPLGAEYGEVLTYGLDPGRGWMDVYPHVGKESGAMCAAVYGVHPFVRINYLDGIEDLSTLAHEHGHALHSHLAMKHQPLATANYAPFVGEIASTVNEKLLSDHLVAKAGSPAKRAFLLGRLVETIRTSLYRQTLFAEFELRAHEAGEKGEPLTAEALRALYEGLVRDYYGPDYTVDPDDGIEWAYVPHFYFKFYLYSYAVGVSAAVALSDRIAAGGEPAVAAYLEMLEAGSSKPPLELLKGAGVDLSQPHAVEAATRLFGDTVARLRKLVPRRKKGGKD